MSHRYASLLAVGVLACSGCSTSEEHSPGEGPAAWETGTNPDWRGNGGGRESAAPGGAGDSEGAVPAGGGTKSGPGSTSGPGTVTTPQPGTLTAGTFDDHLNPAVFDGFLGSFGQSLPAGTPALAKRALIRVRTATGGPASQAQIVVHGDGKTLLSTSAGTDGRALYLPARDGEATSGTYTVRANYGSDTTQGTFTLGQGDWTLTLPAGAPLPVKLDLAFVVDVTGSMSDELTFLKAETAHIADQVNASFPGVDVRYGLIVYRDAGDQFITRGYGFTDLASFHAFLAQQSADGGGDYPEAVHVAFEEAATKLPWRTGNVARILFHIADAPPHDDAFAATFDALAQLRALGVRIYPVAASGVADLAELVMRSAAFMTLGRYVFLTDDSGVGDSHALPHIPCYDVARLENAMIRMISSELAGTLIQPDPSQVIRSVGTSVDGVCQ
jgi:hypothetical protein